MTFLSAFFHRLLHKEEAGGEVIEVSICQRVHHPWVVDRRQHTYAADAVVATHSTSKKAYVLLVDTARLRECELTAGTRNPTDLRPNQI